jgi:hypothetical protein
MAAVGRGSEEMGTRVDARGVDVVVFRKVAHCVNTRRVRTGQAMSGGCRSVWQEGGCKPLIGPGGM